MDDRAAISYGVHDIKVSNTNNNNDNGSNYNNDVDDHDDHGDNDDHEVTRTITISKTMNQLNMQCNTFFLVDGER